MNKFRPAHEQTGRNTRGITDLVPPCQYSKSMSMVPLGSAHCQRPDLGGGGESKPYELPRHGDVPRKKHSYGQLITAVSVDSRV